MSKIRVKAATTKSSPVLNTKPWYKKINKFKLKANKQKEIMTASQRVNLEVRILKPQGGNLHRGVLVVLLLQVDIEDLDWVDVMAS